MTTVGRRGAALIVVIGVAAWLRFDNLGHASFGHDEAWRANWADHGGLPEARRMPPLTFAALRATQRLFGRSELALRLPYAAAGLACVLVVYASTRRFLDPWAGVLAAAVAAVHPVLVQYSRQIKVFSYEALACAILLWAGLEVCRRPARKQIIVFLFAAVCGLGFTFTGALVTVAWLPVLGWIILKRARGAPATGPDAPGSPCARLYLATCAVIAVPACACYVWYSGSVAVDEMRAYYATQEATWPADYSPSGLAVWTGLTLKGIGQYVFDVRYEWPPVSWCVATVELLAVGLSCGVLWRRCRPLCVMLGILCVEVLLAGATRYWPAGRLRTMTFLVPIVAVVVGTGLHRLIRMSRWTPATFGIVGLCFGVPAVRAAHSVLISAAADEHIRPAIEFIKANLEPGDALFVYYGASDAFEFYAGVKEILRQPDDQGPERRLTVRWRDFDVPVLVQPVCDRQDIEQFARRFRSWSAAHPRVWFLFAHNWKSERENWLEHLSRCYARRDGISSYNASADLFSVSPRLECHVNVAAAQDAEHR